MKSKRSVISLFLAVLLLLSLLPAGSISAEQGESNEQPSQQTGSSTIKSYASESERLADMLPAAENGRLALWYDPNTGHIALQNKADGAVRFSSPYDTASYGIDEKVKDQIWSTLNISYLDQSYVRFNYNSSADCMKLNQIAAQTTADGVKITFTLGKQESRLLLPQAIPAERLQQFAGEMSQNASNRVFNNYRLIEYDSLSEASKKEFLKQCPNLEKLGSAYILKSVTDNMKRELSGYFSEVGYTLADLEQDEAAVYGTASDNSDATACFTIPVVFTLKEDCLRIGIDFSEVEYDRELFTLETVNVMEFFGAVRPETDGYILYPDGAGACFPFDGGGASLTVSGDVFGADGAKTFDDSLYGKEQIYLPVYGERIGDAGYLAVIENSAEQSRIHCDINEQSTGLSRGYMSFYPVASEEFSYIENSSAGSMRQSYTVADTRPYEGEFSYLIFPLDAGKADYSDMAAVYRGYLAESGIFTAPTDETDLTLYYGALGSVIGDKRLFGLNFSRELPLTTYSQAQTACEELSAAGVTALKLRYIGWSKKGMDASAYGSMGYSGVLGGKKGYTALKEYAAGHGIGLYLETDFSYIRNNTLFDSFIAIRDAVHKLDKTYAVHYPINYGSMMGDYTRPYLVASPAKMLAAAQRYLKKHSEKSSGVSITNIARELHANYKKNGQTRAEGLALYRQILETAANNQSIMVAGANAYSLAYADDMLELPQGSSEYVGADRAVPFLQMVLHGYIPYAGGAINGSSDWQTAVLKTIESGGNLYFYAAYENADDLVGTGYTDYYYVSYEELKPRVIAAYSRIAAALNGTYGAVMERHEVLENGLVRVTYSNGYKVYINYTDGDLSADGVTVKALDTYTVRQ